MRNNPRFQQILFVLLVLMLTASPAAMAGYNPSYSPHVPIDTVPFYVGGNYDESIPLPQEFFAREFGVWPARYHEMVDYIKAVAAVSDRVRIETYGSSWEGR